MKGRREPSAETSVELVEQHHGISEVNVGCGLITSKASF